MEYVTKGGIIINKVSLAVDYATGLSSILSKLDTSLGAIFTSNFEYPGRYTRWDLGFLNPPLQIVVRQNQVTINSLNQRGEILLAILTQYLCKEDYLEFVNVNTQQISCIIKPDNNSFSEENRSKQRSVFTLLRAIIAIFFSKEDSYLGLYGAFGYDLVFQFEAIKKSIVREIGNRDLVVYLPDEILVVDHRKETAYCYSYDFSYGNYTTVNCDRVQLITTNYIAQEDYPLQSDFAIGEYAQLVLKAKQYFKHGELFEVVPSQTFSVGCSFTPSQLFKQLININPAPYGFIINLGAGEYLVGASPEMYVRVTDGRVETCPISGTIKRGSDSLEDATQILSLLNSAKDLSELTMCTDVDRNDKSRVCKANTVKVIGRRHIEIYSRLIHTVDHVEGHLKDGFDALDAFLSHAWAVTVTGAPKLAAIKFIEAHEKSQRLWYGGAVGYIGFNGDMNTGLTIRTIRVINGIAQIRVGATLLYDSIPEEEEQETQIKASAMIDTVTGKLVNRANKLGIETNSYNKRVLLIDHEDSFVHTLANYFTGLGAVVITLRCNFSFDQVKDFNPHLIVLSPGPGRPADFNLNRTIKFALDNQIPLFGVCLGLQGIVEYFGGDLKVLDYPMHGKSVEIIVHDKTNLFANIDGKISVGLYHSLYANSDSLPKELKVTAVSTAGIIMSISHSKLPIWAVQFHPESLLTMDKQHGLQIIDNLLKHL